MIPLRDDIPARSPPVVNWVLIGVCTLVFLLQLTDSRGELVERFGMVPARVVDPDTRIRRDLQYYVRDRRGDVRLVTEEHVVPPAAVPDWLTFLTCIFLHGGWLHFLGNMWFLFIFGDNVEDRLGRLGYLGFYLATGIVASVAHFLAASGSTAPTIGASGAIAGVMGAYLHLYPRARVLALVPLGFLLYSLVVPAPLFLGVWFLLQLVQGTMTAGATGVAWWAHIGGFAAGYAVALVLGREGPRPPRATQRGGDSIPTFDLGRRRPRPW